MASNQRYPSLTRQVIIHMAWSSLSSKRLRSFLTIAGVIIGIGAIYFLLSLGLGLQDLVTNQVIGSESVKTIDVTSPNSTIVELNQANSDKIKHLTHVQELGGLYASSGTIKLNNSDVDTLAYGIDSEYQNIADLKIIKGRAFDDNESRELLINRAALEASGISDAQKVIGQNLELSVEIEGDETAKNKKLTDTFEIVGVIDSGTGSEAYFSKSFFNAAGINEYTQVKLVVDDIDNIPDLRKQIESLGLETVAPMDTINQIKDLFRYVNLILVGFGSIGMIVAILGMFNTLTISLLERTREIGLMIALGVKNRDIRRLFIYESVLLSVIGSVVGITLASLGGHLFSVIMNRIAINRGVHEVFSLVSTPWWLSLGAVAFMVLIGLGVSYFPARRAGRINPIEALHDE